jgi:hypothetical protein
LEHLWEPALFRLHILERFQLDDSETWRPIDFEGSPVNVAIYGSAYNTLSVIQRGGMGRVCVTSNSHQIPFSRDPGRSFGLDELHNGTSHPRMHDSPDR